MDRCVGKIVALTNNTNWSVKLCLGFVFECYYDCCHGCSMIICHLFLFWSGFVNQTSQHPDLIFKTINLFWSWIVSMVTKIEWKSMNERMLLCEWKWPTCAFLFCDSRSQWLTENDADDLWVINIDSLCLHTFMKKCNIAIFCMVTFTQGHGQR